MNFRKKLEPNNVLVYISINININLNKINKSLRIFLDFIKAFNCISHKTLIHFFKLIEIENYNNYWGHFYI